MFTQPPFKYTQGARAGQLVTNFPPWNDWRHFATEADAQIILGLVRELAPGASLMKADNFEGGYVESGDPNPGNAHVYIISGYVPNSDGTMAPILEFAGDLVDRRTEPQDGIDAYPLPPQGSVLAYSKSDQGLVWVAAPAPAKS